MKGSPRQEGTLGKVCLGPAGQLLGVLFPAHPQQPLPAQWERSLLVTPHMSAEVEVGCESDRNEK